MWDKPAGRLASAIFFFLFSLSMQRMGTHQLVTATVVTATVVTDVFGIENGH